MLVENQIRSNKYQNYMLLKKSCSLKKMENITAKLSFYTIIFLKYGLSIDKKVTIPFSPMTVGQVHGIDITS